MSFPGDAIEKLRQRRDQLLHQVAAIGEMRPGSLVERYRRCGKANCWCAQPGERGHGPSFSLTHAVQGKTVTRIIPPHAVERTRQQIAEYQRFRALAQEVVDASERLCDAELKQGQRPDSEEAAKKGASKPRSPSKSRRKSTR
jgi:hypothetical protein